MKILLACDHDSFNDAIAEFVIKHPWPAKSVFRIVNVVPPIYDYAYAAAVPELMVDIRDDVKEAASERVRRMALKLRDHFHVDNVEEFVLEGHPAQVLLEDAETWPADMIVMGSHGRTGLKKFLMGSVSSAVLEHAPCSVIIVREPVVKEKSDEAQKERVVANA